MSLLPSGVCVVTTLPAGRPAGATAGAVSSLSLSPPLVLACLDRGSRTLAALDEVGRFAINVLGGDSEELARRFATKSEQAVKWEGVGWSKRAGVPWLDAAILRIACSLRDLHEGGDHRIAIGEIAEIDAPGGEPLLFWDGRYRPLADPG